MVNGRRPAFQMFRGRDEPGSDFVGNVENGVLKENSTAKLHC